MRTNTDFLPVGETPTGIFQWTMECHVCFIWA